MADPDHTDIAGSTQIFSHPDLTVGSGVTPDRLLSEFADSTAGMEFHQSPKILISFEISAEKKSSRR